MTTGLATDFHQENTRALGQGFGIRDGECMCPGPSCLWCRGVLGTASLGRGHSAPTSMVTMASAGQALVEGAWPKGCQAQSREQHGNQPAEAWLRGQPGTPSSGYAPVNAR